MTEINVLSRTQIIVVDPATGSVSLINAGPPGAGGGGGGGGGGVGVTDGNKGDITVSDSGDTWTINAASVAPADLTFDPATQAELDLVIGDITALSASMLLKAPLLSPAFTGTPTAPTPAELDNSTKVATTEYVDRFPRLITNDPATYPITIVGGQAVLDLSAAGGGGGSGGGTDAVFTITDDADITKKMKFDAGIITSGQTTLLTIPDYTSSGLIVTDVGDATLTNKTLTVPLINGARIGSSYLGTGNNTAITLTATRQSELTHNLIVTMNYASPMRSPLLFDTSEIKLNFSGTAAGYQFVTNQVNIHNVSGLGVTSLGGGIVFSDSTNLDVRGSANVVAGNWVSYYSNPSWGNVSVLGFPSSGLITAGTYTGFQAAPRVLAGATLIVRGFSTFGMTIAGTSSEITHFAAYNANITGAAPALQRAIYIEALTGATVNIGIQNNASLRQIGPAVFGSDNVPSALYGLEVRNDAFGYGVGTGGSVTQTGSRTTGVTLNKPSGEITLFSQTTLVSTNNAFTLTNSYIDANDVVMVNVVTTGATASSSYIAWVDLISAGSCRINLRTFIAVAVADAPVINFVVIKAVNT